MLIQELRWDYQPQYFSLEAMGSSGLKSLINDIRGISDLETKEEKEAQILQTLYQNMNSERYLHAHAGVMVPVLKTHTRYYQVRPAIFLEFDGGASLSVDGNSKELTPEAQTYLLGNYRYGIETHFTDQHSISDWQHHFRWRVYRHGRKDAQGRRSLDDIVESEKIIDTEEMSSSQITMATDLLYHLVTPNFEIRTGIEELDLSEKTSTERRSIFGKKARSFIQYTHTETSPGKYIEIQPFAGLQYRGHYSVKHSPFLGFHSFFSDITWPLRATLYLDREMMAFMPSLDTRYFQFNYTVRLPYRNPQEHDLWMATTHSIELAIPF